MLHACDNLLCVNPAHLSEGSPADNVADMVAKGRHGRRGAHPGERHHFAKLTKEKVKKIRDRYASCTASQGEIAAEFGISQTQVSRIARGKRWQKGLA